MRLIIYVMSDDLEKSKAFVSYLMDLQNYNERFTIKNNNYELVVESEEIVCKTVKCSESYRGYKYHKLYVDSESEFNEEVFYNTFRFSNIPLRLPSFRGLHLDKPIEYVKFNDYIK